MGKCCASCWQGFRSAGNAVFNVEAYVDSQESVVGKLSGPDIKEIHGQATAILIHKALILTTYDTLPQSTNAFNADITFKHKDQMITRKLQPQKFFVANYELDLVMVSCEEVPADFTPLSMNTNKAYGSSYSKGHKIYILGHARTKVQNVPIAVGAGYVTTPDSQVIKFSTRDKAFWVPGSAGFDSWGNFAFIVCRPHEWLPKDSKARKKRFSLLPIQRRTKLRQSGLTIHTVKNWMETVLLTVLHNKDAAKSLTGDPQAIAKPDLQALQELVHGHTLEAALKEKKAKTAGESSKIFSRPASRPASRPSSRPASRPGSKPASPIVSSSRSLSPTPASEKTFLKQELETPQYLNEVYCSSVGGASPRRDVIASSGSSSPTRRISITMTQNRAGKKGEIRDPVSVVYLLDRALGQVCAESPRPTPGESKTTTSRPTSAERVDKLEKRKVIQDYRKTQKEREKEQASVTNRRPLASRRTNDVKETSASESNGKCEPIEQLLIDEESHMNTHTGNNIASEENSAKKQVKEKKTRPDLGRRPHTKVISASNRLLKHTSSSQRRVSIPR